MREELVKGKHWVTGTIFRIFGTEIVRTDPPVGWNGTSSAKCKEKMNQVWRTMGQQHLSPTSGKRQR